MISLSLLQMKRFFLKFPQMSVSTPSKSDFVFRAVKMFFEGEKTTQRRPTHVSGNKNKTRFNSREKLGIK